MLMNLVSTPVSTVPLPVTPAPEPGDKATMTAQLDETRQNIRTLAGQLDTLEHQHDAYLGNASRLTNEMNSIYERVQPLSKKDDLACAAARYSRYTGLTAGVLMAVGPMVALHTANRLLGGGIFLVDVAVLGASVLATEWSRRTRREIGPQIDSLVDSWKWDKNQLDRLQAEHSGDASRMTSLQSKLDAEHGKEMVLATALSVNATSEPPRPQATIRQEDEALIIGGLRIPKRVSEPGI